MSAYDERSPQVARTIVTTTTAEVARLTLTMALVIEAVGLSVIVMAHLFLT